MENRTLFPFKLAIEFAEARAREGRSVDSILFEFNHHLVSKPTGDGHLSEEELNLVIRAVVQKIQKLRAGVLH